MLAIRRKVVRRSRVIVLGLQFIIAALCQRLSLHDRRHEEDRRRSIYSAGRDKRHNISRPRRASANGRNQVSFSRSSSHSRNRTRYGCVVWKNARTLLSITGTTGASRCRTFETVTLLQFETSVASSFALARAGIASSSSVQRSKSGRERHSSRASSSAWRSFVNGVFPAANRGIHVRPAQAEAQQIGHEHVGRRELALVDISLVVGPECVVKLGVGERLEVLASVALQLGDSAWRSSGHSTMMPCCGGGCLARKRRIVTHGAEEFLRTILRGQNPSAIARTPVDFSERLLTHPSGRIAPMSELIGCCRVSPTPPRGRTWAPVCPIRELPALTALLAPLSRQCAPAPRPAGLAGPGARGAGPAVRRLSPGLWVPFVSLSPLSPTTSAGKRGTGPRNCRWRGQCLVGRGVLPGRPVL